MDEINDNITAGHKRRVTVKLTHPNPLFEKWLTEWKLEAEAKDTNLKYTFQTALKSLRKYPIPLESGKECGILKGFGTRICQMLDRRLHEYRLNKGANDQQQLSDNESDSKPKRVKSSENNVTKPNIINANYIPRTGTGAYAILLALYLNEQESIYPGFMLKVDLMTNAQKYSDKSMNVAEPGTRYTAWSSMKTLLDKGLVRKRGNPAKFSLSEDGRNIAIKLYEIFNNNSENEQPMIKNLLKSTQTTKSNKISDIIHLDDGSNSLKNNEIDKSLNSPQISQKVETITKSLETNLSEVILIDNESNSPIENRNFDHNFYNHVNVLSPHKVNIMDDGSTQKDETRLKLLEIEQNSDYGWYKLDNQPSTSYTTHSHTSQKEYVPNSVSNEYEMLKRIFFKSQELSYVGFVLKSDFINTFKDISSVEILLKNNLIEESMNRISITDKGLNTAITLYATNDLIPPLSPQKMEERCVESNEQIIEGILNSPLFNKFKISHINFEQLENNDFPSPPKSPLNWEPKTSNFSKSPTTPKSMEVINLDSDDNLNDVIITKNPIFTELKNKFFEIQNDLSGNSMKKVNSIDTMNNKIFSKTTKEPSTIPSKILNENHKKFDFKKVNKEKSTDNNNSPNENINIKTNFDDIIFLPSKFEIILLVDTQETSGSKKSNLNDLTQQELTRYGITYEIRRLSVGDFAWIARNNVLNQELVLPYILERKRMDDLGSSIKDGRFHEQKFRLKHSGIQNLIYLVESYGSKDHLGLPYNTLLQAATNTQVQENFTLKFTECHKHSMAYISTLTKQLIEIFKDKTLTGCSKECLINSDITDQIIPLMTFPEFNKASTKSKNIKVRELFVRQLLQIKGVSFEKAMAITEKYPTPLRLRIAYMKNPDYIGEKLLSSIQYGKMNRYIGAVISNTIYQLYTRNLF